MNKLVFQSQDGSFISPDEAQAGFRVKTTLSIADPAGSQGVLVEHPCDAFARSAGYPSWQVALVDMRAGKVVSGAGPRIGKTMLSYNMFLKQIHADGLAIVVDDCGVVAVGLQSNFSA
jgi:hypothetical protein